MAGKELGGDACSRRGQQIRVKSWLQRSAGATESRTAVRDSFNNDFEELFDCEESVACLGIPGYTLLNLLGIGAWSAATILLWSNALFEAGDPARPLAVLQGSHWLSKPLIGLSLLLFASLYLLDFFLPPLLPGQYLVLWDHDHVFGRALFASAACLLLAGAVFTALYYPGLPMLVFVLLSPLVPLATRLATRPQPVDRLHLESMDELELDEKVRNLKLLVGQAEDILNFYKAVAVAFVASSLACSCFWAISLASGDVCFQACSAGTEASGGAGVSPHFFEAICPAVVAVADLIFGLFALMRVLMHKFYINTDKSRNALALHLRADPKALERRRVELCHRLVHHEQGTLSQGQPSVAPTISRGSSGQFLTEVYVSQEQKGMRQLTTMVRGVGITFVCLLGLTYTGALLLWTNSPVASLFMQLLAGFFTIFMAVISLGAARVVRELGRWLLELPVCRQALQGLQHDWARALLLCIFLPMLLFFAFLSMLNQLVRRCRGISGVVLDADSSGGTEEAAGRPGAAAAAREGGANASGSTPGALDVGFSEPQPAEAASRAPAEDIMRVLREVLGTPGLGPHKAGRSCFTARFYTALTMAGQLDWLSLLDKSYTWCILPFAYSVGSPLFGAFFSMLVHILANVQFYLICILTFVVGVVAFLWPTIPGLVVYMFGGVLLPGTCPIPDGDPSAQFWVGAGINIALGWFLKLFACAVQQKGIGERLGKDLRVRQMCRVHAPFMRAIESVLRRPGLSVGKVAILCGGPDWPTSVMCGILGLSLLQCEIGTMPIISYVAPCGLCGSLYLKRSEGDGWEKAAGAMVALTTLATGLLYVVIWWVIQREYELKSEELSKPLPEHADLFWLDHKVAELDRRCATPWSELPKLLRWAFAAGAVFQIIVSHVLLLGYKYLFGDFSVSEQWTNIQWYASYIDEEVCHTHDGIVPRKYCVFSTAGLVAISIYLLCWIPYYALTRHLRLRNVSLVAEIDTEFDEEMERRWIEDFRRTVEQSHPSPVACSFEEPLPLAVAESVVPCPPQSCKPEGELWQQSAGAIGDADTERPVEPRTLASPSQADWSIGFCFVCASWVLPANPFTLHTVALRHSGSGAGAGTRSAGRAVAGVV